MFSSGRYLEHFASIPKHVRWTAAQIERSMRDTINARPGAGDLWVFAYGSLIWNPVCRFETRRKATLDGWHRSFCLRTIAGRSSPRSPGRMLSLESVGKTEGIALRLPVYALEEELPLLWVREMPTGAYQPIWAPIAMEDGTCPTALIFVANQNHHLYEPNASVASVAAFIASAYGPLGTNAEYLFKLKESLAAWNIADSYIDDLVDAVIRRQSELDCP
ncbi:gamma-glutamylcyclotransferase [Paraburkholderia sp. GAS334]|uniref:gamma-glutamylcyclotransferase n=1 Tax=Paraburkholderia sp. GAS334 TaxID=3035131 RepID=UPI003D235C62